MTTGLEAFGYNRIDTDLLALAGKTRRRHDMRDRNAMTMKKIGIERRIPGGSENNLHLFLDEYLHQLIDFGIHQRHIHTERITCRLTTFRDMLPQHIRVHRAGSKQP